MRRSFPASLCHLSLRHSKSALVVGKFAPLNRTHAIHHIGFHFSTERTFSQPGTASSHFNLGICYSLCKRVKSRGLGFPHERQMPLKVRGQILGTSRVRLLQILQNQLKAVGKIWPAQKARIPPGNQQLPWGSSKGE